MDNPKAGEDQQKWKYSKKMKTSTLEVKYESTVNEVTEEIAGHGSADTAVVWVPLNVQPEELG